MIWIFYQTFNDLEILHTRVQNLTWSHVRTTLRVDNPVAARWYLQTASTEMWSVRTLDRNISTQYFERHFKQPQILENPENKEVPDKLEILKTPVMAEFLGFKQNTDYGHWNSWHCARLVVLASFSRLSVFSLPKLANFHFQSWQSFITS